MERTAKPIRENRTITVDFHDETTYFALVGTTQAFIEFVLAFMLAIGVGLSTSATRAEALASRGTSSFQKPGVSHRPAPAPPAVSPSPITTVATVSLSDGWMETDAVAEILTARACRLTKRPPCGGSVADAP